MSVRGDQTSGRLPSALASVPTMKPAWTAIVSAALPLSSSAHSRSSAGRTAEALNQRARAPSSASERTVSCRQARVTDRKSTRLNSSHGYISYAVFCLKKKKNTAQRAARHADKHDDARRAHLHPTQPEVT